MTLVISYNCGGHCGFLGHITVLLTYMRPIITDRVAWSVDLSQ